MLIGHPILEINRQLCVNPTPILLTARPLFRDVRHILKNTVYSMLDVVLQLVVHCAITSSAIMLSCVVDMCFQINTPRWAHFVCIIISILGFLGIRKSNRAGLFYSTITGAFVFLLELMFAALFQAAYTNDALRALLLTVGGLFAVLAICTIYDRHRGRKPRLLAYFLDAQWVCCIILAFFVSQLGIDAVIKISDALYFQKAYEQQSQVQQEQLKIQAPAFSLDDYTDELLVLLDDEEWSNMASPDKLMVLELVLEEEVSYFGLPFELTLTYHGTHGKSSMKCPVCGKFSLFDFDTMAATRVKPLRHGLTQKKVIL